jgi:mannose-1-phosphate guanylyltransferase
VQAVILVGGEGTRLRPLTSLVPKPVIPLVDRPFLVHMIDWLRGHGVTDVILSCGFLPTKIEEALGDGSAYGVSLRYVVEPEPRGTAGALKYAEDLLDDRFLMLNGDVLTDVDITAQIAQHAATGASATLGLVPVEDPSAYGLVLLDEDHSVTGFLEKPEPEQLDGITEYLISAGIYVLEREVVDRIEPGVKVSIERVIWPQLVAEGSLFGFADRDAYWLDIGTPDRYLQGTFDILAGNVHTDVPARDGQVHIGHGVRIEDGARVGPLAVLGDGVVVGAGATVERAVVLEEARIGSGCELRDCIVAPRASLGDGSAVTGGAMVGEGATVGTGFVLDGGAKVAPGETVGG